MHGNKNLILLKQWKTTVCGLPLIYIMDSSD